VVDADICKPRVASTESVAGWTEFSKAPYVKEIKTIVHPGEVNKIRELPQHPEIIVTHTDAPELYVWNVDRQPDQKKGTDKKWPCAPYAELVLTGHEKEAQFPLATCNVSPMVASGGTDKLVLLWNLQDAMESILDKNTKPDKRRELANRTRLEGHKKTVEDLVFKPGSAEQLVSVGDDTQVLFWDTRSGTSPVTAVTKAHDSHDIHTVDWSGLSEHLLVTGAADGSLKVWDRRKLSYGGGNGGKDVLKVFSFHTDAIMRVEWHPTAQGVLASGGEDHLVVVWDLNRNKGSALSEGAPGSSNKGKQVVPPEVMFKHVGHRQGKVVDFQWCPSEPWTMLSVSDDTDAGEGEEAMAGRGGGTMQLWRINDFIYRDEEEVVKELESHREWILHGRNPPKQTLNKPGAANGVKPKPPSGAVAAAAGTSSAAAAPSASAGGAGPSTSAGVEGVKVEPKAEPSPAAAAADEKQEQQQQQQGEVGVSAVGKAGDPGVPAAESKGDAMDVEAGATTNAAAAEETTTAAAEGTAGRPDNEAEAAAAAAARGDEVKGDAAAGGGGDGGSGGEGGAGKEGVAPMDTDAPGS